MSSETSVPAARRGVITDAAFNQSAALGVGNGVTIDQAAKVYRGQNARGDDLIGSVIGEYAEADLGDLTPAGVCRENGCDSGEDGAAGGRPNNVIICPIPSTRDHAYVTFGGGGLLVADMATTPMSIIGEYGNQAINGAGCGGVQVGDDLWLNAGVSASGAGAEQSTFSIYTIDDAAFTSVQPENIPAPVEVYKDQADDDGNAANTATIGNVDGKAEPNTTGQIPGITTRRDAHGMAVTLNGRYIHTFDRIQNTVDVINTKTNRQTSYDLTSSNGHGKGVGPCDAASVDDDPAMPANDPAPDLFQATPDERYLAVAFRGPTPVSVTHAAQGSCPGVGIVRLHGDGVHGTLVTVLRTTNTVDDTPVAAPGGHAYTGAEHSDVHGAAVRTRVEDAAPQPPPTVPTADGTPPVVGSADPARYVTHLFGSQEVPPTETSAFGWSTWDFNHAAGVVRYRVLTGGLDDIAAAHLHLGAAGENGPPVVALEATQLSGAGPTRAITASITEADLIGPLEGKSLADLRAAVEAGAIYVNVHTSRVPSGEIRGQLRR